MNKMLDTALAKYGSSGVAIGAFIMVVVIINAFLKNQKEAREDNERANEKFVEALGKLTTSTDQNSFISQELLTFMRGLNGRLSVITRDKLDQADKIIKNNKRK